MLGYTFEKIIIDYPSIGRVIRKALPLRPGGRPLPPVEAFLPKYRELDSLAPSVLFALTAIPVDLRVGAVGITTTRDKLAKQLCVPDSLIIYVGTVLQRVAENWFREKHNLSKTEPVSKEVALYYARKINPLPNLDILIDDACTGRIVTAIKTNPHLPIILDTKLLWLLLLKGKDCPIAMAQYLPSNLVQLTTGFTCDTNIASARHVRRRDKKQPEYQPTEKELLVADEERAQRYQGDRKAFNTQYGVSYTPQVIFKGLNLVVDTTYLTPEQQVKKITKYLMKRYGSSPTAMKALGLISST